MERAVVFPPTTTEGNDRTTEASGEPRDAETLWRRVERIAGAGNAKTAAALALEAAGAHDQAEQLRTEVREMVTRDWLRAMRSWARAADSEGLLDAGHRWLLNDSAVVLTKGEAAP